ncbi:hypothetical protein E4U42_002092 [Claviceps africana]|uniref:Uncharacterized protein n=1 Tax=Claviceps africana TaxID=83212 RepID=A0A8K0NHQ3_9HYPO|nr:hypothetical protein E4U42_002092 [Claviceps africana]
MPFSQLGKVLRQGLGKAIVCIGTVVAKQERQVHTETALVVMPVIKEQRVSSFSMVESTEAFVNIEEAAGQSTEAFVNIQNIVKSTEAFINIKKRKTLKRVYFAREYLFQRDHDHTARKYPF